MASVRTQAPWMQHAPADFDEAADLAAEPLFHDECGDQQHQPAYDEAWHDDELDPADDDAAADEPPADSLLDDGIWGGRRPLVPPSAAPGRGRGRGSRYDSIPGLLSAASGASQARASRTMPAIQQQFDDTRPVPANRP